MDVVFFWNFIVKDNGKQIFRNKIKRGAMRTEKQLSGIINVYVFGFLK